MISIYYCEVPVGFIKQASHETVYFIQAEHLLERGRGRRETRAILIKQKVTYKEKSDMPMTFIRRKLTRSETSIIFHHQFLLCASMYKHTACLHISFYCSPVQRGTTFHRIFNIITSRTNILTQSPK